MLGISKIKSLWANVSGMLEPRTRQIGVTIDDPLGNERVYTELSDPAVYQKYDEMRRVDSELKAVIQNAKLPIRSAVYQVVTEREEVRMFCERQIGLAESGNNISFDNLLIDMLSYMDFGFYVAEVTTKRVDDMGLELSGVHIRPAESIRELYFDEDNNVNGFQQVVNKGWIEVRENVIHMAYSAEGNDPKGRSLLEACVADYDSKQEFLRYARASARRFAVGVPTLFFPPSTPDAQVEAYKQALKDYAKGEVASMVLPGDTNFAVAGLEGADRFPTLEYVRYHNQQMAKAYLSQVLELGTTETGSRAVGNSFLTSFYNAEKAIAGQIAEVITNKILTPLVNYNFGEGEVVRLVPQNILPEDDAQMLTLIKDFVAAGIITLDDAQRMHVMELLELPQGEV